MAYLKNEPEQYKSLSVGIEEGRIKIPQFQRNFVWSLKASASLIDSMIKHYPIGSFIFWNTQERLRSIKNIGGVKLPEPPAGDYIKYVLDGQQRITTIYTVLEGKTIKHADGNEVDYSDIFIDLNAKEDEDIATVDVSDKPDNSYIKVSSLFRGDLEELGTYPKEYQSKLQKYRDILTGFDFSIISLYDANIDVATEVFTRLNVGGKSLTLFEIMVAKTYDEDSKFDLSEKCLKVTDKLRDFGYETIPNTTILQVIAVLITSAKRPQNISFTSKQILSLDKNDFIATWDTAIEAIYDAINYFKNYYMIPVSKLLPYTGLIVLYSYYFYKVKNVPTGEIQERLTDLFWRISLGNRYNSGSESKIVKDIHRINEILDGKMPRYEWAIYTEASDIINDGWFSTGRSYIKAILSIMASKAPQSFKDNSKVNISNDYLKVAHSKNYHHFFPKAFMKKKLKGEEDWRVNCIANITIVDDFLNKRDIKAKPPSEYIQNFAKDNKDIAVALGTHLIGDLNSFGIIDDDFEKFITSRAEMISKEIKKRIIVQDKDAAADDLVQYKESEEEVVDE